MPAPKVVFVEDDAAVRTLVQFWLVDAGFEVHLAEDGVEGMRTIRAVEPDLVITDAMMPFMTGDELVEIMTNDAELRSIPIIMATAAASPLRVSRMKERGCHSVLAKPLDEHDFVAAARDAIASATQP